MNAVRAMFTLYIIQRTLVTIDYCTTILRSLFLQHWVIQIPKGDNCSFLSIEENTITHEGTGSDAAFRKKIIGIAGL